ncbi:IS66 family insertion sequence element accessory protein TnpB [bacterium]|nr:IS66 family insertion sequence element accessory protein TnpB [bacterium]
MILLTHETRILLGVAPADFRKGVDGFVALCQNTLALQPRDGSVIVFINRARTMIRALSYDGSGYWLMTKRLSKGRFTGWPSGQRALSHASARELRIILSGATWTSSGNATDTSTQSSVNVALASSPASTTIISNTL